MTQLTEQEMVQPASITDNLKVSGQLRIQHFDEFGNLKEDRNSKESGRNNRKEFYCSRLGGASSAVMGWMEVGTDNTAAVVGNTTLGLPVSGSRTALTSLTSGVPTANAIRHICTFGAGVGTGSLVEAGIFNAASAGTMLCRTVFGVITKGALDSITITWI